MKRITRTLMFAISLWALGVSCASADWLQDGVPVSPVPVGQTEPKSVGDGAGGIIVAYNQADDIYVQRIDSKGNPLWGESGVPVCAQPGVQIDPQLVKDGAGGVIITWSDFRSGNYDIYMQRVDGGGNPLWTADGKQVTSDPASQLFAEIVTDDLGGAFIAWEDQRNGNSDIYAQSVDQYGNLHWSSGFPLCVEASSQFNVVLTSDGSSGLIAAWEDARSGALLDIWGQRMDLAGNTLWFYNGLPVTVAAGNQSGLDIAADGSGGAVIVFESEFGADPDIWAQRMDQNGSPLWGVNGSLICGAGGPQQKPKAIPDGTGGSIVTWEDSRNGGQDIYAQRINGPGLNMWFVGGLVVCDANNAQVDPFLNPDGEGGAVIAWQDLRTDNGDIFAQRITGAGQTLWDNNGKPVVEGLGTQFDHCQSATSDGGFAFAMVNQLSGIQVLYAQRLEPKYGEWGAPEPEVTSVKDVPVDQGGLVSVNWMASGRDNLNQQLITTYSIWRAIGESAFVAATESQDAPGRVVGSLKAVWTLDSKTYMVESTATGSLYWEFTGQQPATSSPAYSYSASTLFDSTSIDPAVHHFRVIAQTSDPFTFFESRSDSGYSVDNVAPGAPSFLVAVRAGGSDVDLDWSTGGMAEGDLNEYWVYRGVSSGFPNDEFHFLTSSSDTMVTDTSADPGTAFYYHVVAVDIHENHSGGSNEAMVTGSVSGAPYPTGSLVSLQVLPNYPNPIHGGSHFRFGLPKESDVSVEVYDVSGRRVFSSHLSRMPAGWQTLPFNGKDDSGVPLPSGVYFSRIIAANEVRTNKMVITR